MAFALWSWGDPGKLVQIRQPYPLPPRTAAVLYSLPQQNKLRSETAKQLETIISESIAQFDDRALAMMIQRASYSSVREEDWMVKIFEKVFSETRDAGVAEIALRGLCQTRNPLARATLLRLVKGESRLDRQQLLVKVLPMFCRSDQELSAGVEEIRKNLTGKLTPTGEDSLF